ncbi:MAG: IclR family transcriptional regulator [Alphaproteobacteria bacterium]
MSKFFGICQRQKELDLEDDEEIDGAARRRSVQSITVGTVLLDVLSEATKPLQLRDLSKLAEMHPAKARRYLVSFLECGLVTQRPDTGCYDLGPMALKLGFAAMSRMDPIQETVDEAKRLSERLDRTVLVSVWSDAGPIIVSWSDASEIVACNLRVGSVLPLADSASGKLFLAHLPEKTTSSLLSKVLESRKRGPDGKKLTKTAVRTIASDVRQSGLATTSGDLLPGLNAIGAPVFNSDNRISAVIAEIHMSQDSHVVQGVAIEDAVLAAALKVSEKLGYRGKKVD